MNLSHALKAARVSPAVLAVVLAGAFAGSAQAAVTSLTMNPTAQLSPSGLHAVVTGTITCAPGDATNLYGQVIGGKNEPSGYGSGTATCDGTSQPFTIDVSSNGGFPYPGATTGPFKAGKAIGQVTAQICDYFVLSCSSTYVDGQVKLVK